MLLRIHRIPKSAKRLTVITQKQMPGLKFFVSVNELGIARFQIAVPKRVDTRAVVRNRLKRQVADCLRPFTEKKRGLDIRIFLRSEVVTLSKEVICATISQVLSPLFV